MNSWKYLTKYVTVVYSIRTAAESAERKPVIPRSGTLGRVGAQLEAVVGVGLEALDNYRQIGRVCGEVV